MASILKKQVRYLQGVGPKRAALFRKIGVNTVEDLLYLKPRRYLDRRRISKIKYVKPGKEATVIGRIVQKYRKKIQGKIAFVAVILDGTDWMELVFFTTAIEKQFKLRTFVVASGKVYQYWGVKVMFHPDWEIIEDQRGQIQKAGRIIPVYPATEGLKPSGIEKLVRMSLELAKEELTDIVPSEIRKKRSLLPKTKAFKLLHFPDVLRETELARKTLAYEEFFIHQLRLKLKRLERKGLGISLKINQNGYAQQFLNSLPFQLTNAQHRVINEIENDLTQDSPMHRLLQGDVGSGKTVIAVYTMLVGLDNGLQSALMAPTEILAEQHFLVISEFLNPLGIKPVLLVGKQPRRERMEAIKSIEDGSARFVIGTHTLIQEGINFKNLGVAVVDEQHRFGVHQRAMLLQKSHALPHFLVMTATPIPRTLAMTYYGDLDVSYLDEKPPGRGSIKTYWKHIEKRNEVYQWLFEQVKLGHQAFVIAPLIEKSEKLEVQSATDLYEELKIMTPADIKIGLIHGRMKREERQKIMEKFRDRDFSILVATTVIEVGIDIPSATIMVIEHAERFGLAQLHQLRGRIGRGEYLSYCILITPRKLTDDARKRLKVIIETTDGFQIAEADLRIRGPGELLGKEQHGFLGFRIGDMIRDEVIIQKVRKDIDELLQNDPFLVKPEHRQLRKYLSQEEEIERTYYVG